MGLRRSIVATASTMVLLVLGVAGIVAAGGVAAQEPTTVGCDERPGLVEWDGDAGTSAWSRSGQLGG